MESAFGCFNSFYFVDDILAFDDFSKDAVAPTLRVRRGVVQEIVVLEVDEELARGRMGVRCSRHRNRVGIVLESIGGFVLDGRPALFFSHPWRETPTLDHEPVDHTMKQRVAIKAGFDVFEKIPRRFWRMLDIEFKCDYAEIGV